MSKEYAKKANKDINFSSAWIKATWSPIAENSRKILDKEGIDASSHISRKITQVMITDSDKIITMTMWHKQKLLEAFDVDADKVYTLKEIVGSEGDIEDPYQQDYWKYEEVAKEIKECVVLLIDDV